MSPGEEIRSPKNVIHPSFGYSSPQVCLSFTPFFDFLSAPVIKTINMQKYTGTIGEVITIRAVDDFRVIGVQVTIYAADGSLLEQGAAIAQSNGLDWG